MLSMALETRAVWTYVLCHCGWGRSAPIWHVAEPVHSKSDSSDLLPAELRAKYVPEMISYSPTRVNKEKSNEKTQTRDYFSTLGSLLKWSIYALHVYSANAQEHNGNHSVTEIIQICYSDIDFLFKYAWLHGPLGRARLSMPSVFGMDGDIDDFKPWEENQAFQRSEQTQIQRGPMIHTPQGPQVFWWSFGPSVLSKWPSLVFFFTLPLSFFFFIYLRGCLCVWVIQWH